MTAEEQHRANRFHFDKDRFHFIAARGVLRWLLGHYLAISPPAVQFAYGKNGKPELDEMGGEYGRSLQFNLSHSGTMGLAAFTHGRAVGVDIEEIRPLSDGPDIAKHYFSEWENRIFFSLPEADYPQAFFNCWTRKEAFIKAIGDGLTYPLDKFDVTLTPNEPARLLRIEGSEAKAKQWQLLDLQPEAGYAAAVIAAGQNWHTVQFRVPNLLPQ